MADNEAVETAPPEEAVPELTSEQSFAYWLTMLPFLGIAGAFVFDFSKTPGDFNKLWNAAAIIVVGIFVAALVNAMGADKQEDNTSSDAS